MPEDNSPQYDVIYDGGTLEHIFNAPQALKTIHGLLKQDGIIVHGSPSHNHVDHGFYMFSPTFFWDYYSANKYNILTSYLFQYSSPDNCTWEVFEYQPGSLDDFSFGGFGKTDLYVMDPDGISNVVRLTQNQSTNNSPSFSPDGKQIVFASSMSGSWELWMINVDGTNLVQLTDDVYLDAFPDWSP